jgi:hypothetical protein
MRVALAIAAILIGAGTSALIAGSARWSGATRVAIAALASESAAPSASFDSRSVDDIPAPAARYFRRVLRDGQRMIRDAIVTQDAEFFINGAWRPLRATQHFTTAPPGFVWDARIGMAPLLAASVRDSYINGRGGMQASMFGLYSIVNQVDVPELNEGALQRYLAEAVVIPTALLPSARVSWSRRDDRSAIVTMRDSGDVVSLLFDFDDQGFATRITGARFKEDGGTYRKQPWHVECGDYKERDGMLIPLRCEVAWVGAGRAESYWRGRTTAIEYRYN